jgi:EAL domain-containing protein (putative c-di-GMP-specific phosphodiesterase class I)
MAIDDFGTGYSSLAYLQALPVSELKIDKAFVIGMHGNGNGKATIVRSTNDLGHNLGLTVVAEGVEDERTLELLARYGCDGAQGYHIARPMPASDLARWLSDSPWAAARAAD